MFYDRRPWPQGAMPGSKSVRVVRPSGGNEPYEGGRNRHLHQSQNCMYNMILVTYYSLYLVSFSWCCLLLGAWCLVLQYAKYFVFSPICSNCYLVLVLDFGTDGSKYLPLIAIVLSTQCFVLDLGRLADLSTGHNLSLRSVWALDPL